jgi:aminoglycoside phosphotransferase
VSPSNELADLPPEWRRAFDRVEHLVGGRAVAAERQARWRPAWFLEVQRDGEIGDRGQGQGGGETLEREMGVLRILEAHGIPAPHVFGFCEDPRGIVMERLPGRANLATAESDDERAAVLDHYVDLLVEMHRIDPAEFEAVGLERPADGHAAALVDLPRWEKSYREGKRAPEPLIELCLRWLGRNVPAHRTKTAFLTGDSGQFLFDAGRVTGVIDLELATLGDPLADLGALRSRDISEPLGDLSRAYRRYAQATGEPIDRTVLDFHALRFALNTPLAVAPLCQQPPPGLDFAQYLGWNLVYGRLALEILAEREGIPLEPPELPEDLPRPQPAHDALLSMLDAGRTGGYEADAAYRIGQYLHERDRRGAGMLEEDLDEAAVLLGRRPHDRSEADAELEALALAEPPEREAELVQHLYRRTLREESLLAPAMRELEGARFQKIDL